MISNIYNLDLNSINNMITEMNRELGNKGGSSVVSSSGGSLLIFDKLMESPDTVFVAEDLDGMKHGGYYIELIINNPTASTTVPRLYYNKDLTNTNYNYVNYTLAWANDAILGNSTGITSGNEAIYNGYINISPFGHITTHVLETGANNFTGATAEDHGHHYKGKVDNLTRIDIVCSVQGSIGKNSRLRLWRRV